MIYAKGGGGGQHCVNRNFDKTYTVNAYFYSQEGLNTRDLWLHLNYNFLKKLIFNRFSSIFGHFSGA